MVAYKSFYLLVINIVFNSNGFLKHFSIQKNIDFIDTAIKAYRQVMSTTFKNVYQRLLQLDDFIIVRKLLQLLQILIKKSY